MSYIPTEWKTGDIVSSAGLNKIENRIEEMIGEHILLVNAMQDESLDKSYDEILAAVASRKKVVMFKFPRANSGEIYGYDFIPMKTISKQPTIGSIAITTTDTDVSFGIGIDGRLMLMQQGNTHTPE